MSKDRGDVIANKGILFFRNRKHAFFSEENISKT
jgi:hypothetical protein